MKAFIAQAAFQGLSGRAFGLNRPVFTWFALSLGALKADLAFLASQFCIALALPFYRVFMLEWLELSYTAIAVYQNLAMMNVFSSESWRVRAAAGMARSGSPKFLRHARVRLINHKLTMLCNRFLSKVFITVVPLTGGTGCHPWVNSSLVAVSCRGRKGDGIGGRVLVDGVQV